MAVGLVDICTLSHAGMNGAGGLAPVYGNKWMNIRMPPPMGIVFALLVLAPPNRNPLGFYTPMGWAGAVNAKGFWRAKPMDAAIPAPAKLNSGYFILSECLLLFGALA